jgi:CheY-like chemotaxis protein
VTTTLLAVDDSKTMRKVLEITFAGEDYRTVLAENSAEALAKLGTENPAVALVDAQLGEESGYVLCQSMKRESPSLPVIILSSRQKPFDRARGSSVGADDFMDKPFDTQQLIDKVSAVLRAAAQAPAPPAPRPAVQPDVPKRPPEAAARPEASRGRMQTLAYGTPPSVPVGQSARDAQRSRPGSPVPAAAKPVSPAKQAPARILPIAPTPVSGVPAQPDARRPAPASRPDVSAAARGVTPSAAQPPAPAVDHAAAATGELAEKIQGLGLSEEQVQAVLKLSREVVEQVVWEVVPVLAETVIQEEIRRLTRE